MFPLISDLFFGCMITNRLGKSKPDDVFTGSTSTEVHVNTPVHAGDPGPSKVMRSGTTGNVTEGIL